MLRCCGTDSLRPFPVHLCAADGGTILISRYFVNADLALNSIRRFLLAYGAKDPALDRPDLPWDLTVQQPRLYGPELFYFLCMLKCVRFRGSISDGCMPVPSSVPLASIFAPSPIQA